MRFLNTLVTILAFTLCLSVQGAFAASPASKQELRKALEEILKENPELVLDILRDNSEFVLDVAQHGSEVRRQRILTSQWQDDLLVPKSVFIDNRPTVGPAKAPVTIVAFTDFTCMYCQQGEQTLQRIEKSYEGKVRIVYKSLPMKSHPGSVEASEFMLAAWQQDKNKSWKLFDLFFANRDRILSNDGQAFMRGAAMESGLNMKKLLEDAKSAKIQKLLKEDEDDANRLGITGTPCFLVNNIVIRGALQEDLFRQAIDLALVHAK